ncbi:hypothetical protein EVG20_g7628 [Dentipellis fragilis]|uniref:Trehalase n=1 Tax=Dentipellis fragilis TaxID=205917 RepID=A0A4Y9YBD5_9AGAM|nr:hypothetical protein EVG20_g7628 [Dentipellis fragilis]
MFTKLAATVFIAQAARAAPQGSVTALTSVPAPTVTVSTAIASPSASLSATLPSQIPDPPKQAWCPSEIFCAGPLLQTVNIAQLYADPKTFVDKPTNGSAQAVLQNFASVNSTNATEGALVNFVDANFRGEGAELEGLPIPNFEPSPAFLKNVSDPLLKSWSQVVHGFWTQLIRGTNESAVCAEGSASGCGRFREQYYWDSFWIIEGLLKSELYDLVNATLQNFMDEIEMIGFIPNGGRIYYLNRSQPPLFIQMLSNYVAATNDTTILQRALPLAEKELTWWKDNRTLNVTSPFTNQTYAMARYAANNTAPRPESYLTDYNTANDPTLSTPLTEDERSNLYAELASGAETGWDYTARFIAEPLAGGSNNTSPALRTLQVRSTIPICLNSILYKANVALADLYTLSGNHNAASQHQSTAVSIRAGILDLFWDGTKLAFYDFNMTSKARNSIFTVASFYPLWAGIIPNEVLSSQSTTFSLFASLNLVLNRYNGTFPTTFLETGLQWDAPNAWPPHQYIALQALAALPANLTSNALPSPPSNGSTYALVPSGQLNLAEDALPGQPLLTGKQANATKTGPHADINSLNGTVVNGGNATQGEGWRDALARELANRYFASAFCSWYSTGGSIPGLLPRLSDQALNVSNSVNNTGNMFEKFSNQNIDAGGSGGEYTVQAGFGWTNGVVLWVASTYGKVLVAPQCPSPLLESSTSTSSGKTSGAMRGVAGYMGAAAASAAVWVVMGAW